MGNKALIYRLLLPVLIVTFIISGCAGVSGEVISFADSAAENILSALNSRDYINFKKDLSDEMTKAFTEEEFMKFTSYLESTIGKYGAGSKKFSGSAVRNDGIVIIYEADYTGEAGSVTVTLAIREADGEKYEISGLWFNSALLRENPYQ
jgi:hypothetical protein